MTVVGYQIPNFTYPDMGATDIFGSVVAQAIEADQSGFDAVTVMDHFYQLAGLGDPDHIISVNTDPHCPMMQMSDLAVVADANATLEALHAALVEGTR